MSVHNLITHTLFTATGTTVGAAATLIGPTINLQYIERVDSLELRVSSAAGTANVRAEYQTSPDGVNWDDEDDNPDITASTLVDKPGNPEGWNSYSMPAPLAQYVRVLIDDISAAGLTDTVVEAKLLCRERLS